MCCRSVHSYMTLIWPFSSFSMELYPAYACLLFVLGVTSRLSFQSFMAEAGGVGEAVGLLANDAGFCLTRQSDTGSGLMVYRP